MGRKHVWLAVTIVLAVPAAQGQAQEIGAPGSGRQLAERLCAQCHAIQRDPEPSPDERATPFRTIASLPGMTSVALTAALNTTHRSMPNIFLEPDDQADIIAYVLSLR